MTENISGAILAGGRSSRMRQNKAQLRLGDRSFLEVQLEKLRDAGIGELMISEAPDITICPNIPENRRVKHVKDEFKDRGPLAAIAAVLKASEAPYCFIISVDAVTVKTSTIRQLTDLAQENSADITLLASKSRPQPLIGVYKKVLFREAESILLSGRGAVRELFEAHRPLLLLRDEDDPELLSCNTPEEYEHILRITL